MTNRTIKFRAWIPKIGKMGEVLALNPNKLQVLIKTKGGETTIPMDISEVEIMQFIGLHVKNGKEIFEGDIVGKESVYHFIERKGWEPKKGNWKIIGEKTKNFIGDGDEKYIAGYRLSVVEWKDKSCGFEPFSDSEENCRHCGGGANPQDFEVIGNVYENPKLLVKNKK